MSARLASTLLAVALCASGCGTASAPDEVGAAAATMDDCQVPDFVPEPPPQFTPYEARLSVRITPPKRYRFVGISGDSSAGGLPTALDGRPGRTSSELLSPDTSWTVYTNSQSGSIPELLKSGSLVLTVRSGDASRSSYTQAMEREFPGRANAVQVGPYMGAMHRADPDEEGFRPLYVGWTDSQGSTLVLSGDRTPAELLGLARRVACGT